MTKYFQNEQSPLKNFLTYRTAIAKLDRGQKSRKNSVWLERIFVWHHDAAHKQVSGPLEKMYSTQAKP